MTWRFYFPRLEVSQENGVYSVLKCTWPFGLQATQRTARRSESDIDMSDDVATTATAANGKRIL